MRRSKAPPTVSTKSSTVSEILESDALRVIILTLAKDTSFWLILHSYDYRCIGHTVQDLLLFFLVRRIESSRAGATDGESFYYSNKKHSSITKKNRCYRGHMINFLMGGAVFVFVCVQRKDGIGKYTIESNSRRHM